MTRCHTSGSQLLDRPNIQRWLSLGANKHIDVCCNRCMRSRCALAHRSRVLVVVRDNIHRSWHHYTHCASTMVFILWCRSWKCNDLLMGVRSMKWNYSWLMVGDSLYWVYNNVVHDTVDTSSQDSSTGKVAMCTVSLLCTYSHYLRLLHIATLHPLTMSDAHLVAKRMLQQDLSYHSRRKR